MTVSLAIPPLTVKNRPCVLIRTCALNQKNTVNVISTYYGIKFIVDSQNQDGSLMLYILNISASKLSDRYGITVYSTF